MGCTTKTALLFRLSKVEGIRSLKIRQTLRLTFDLLNEDILKSEIERVFGDLIVFRFCQRPVDLRILARLVLRRLLRHDADENVRREISQITEAASAVVKLTR